jgi:hypothetical protein
VTYTFDHFFPTPDPPTIVTVVDVDGARIHLQLVNASPQAVKLDMPVEFVFRRIHATGGRPNYYWKAAPLEADPAGQARSEAQPSGVDRAGAAQRGEAERSER